MESRGFGLELYWLCARRQKRRLLYELEGLLDAGPSDDLLKCLGELRREWRRVGSAGPGHEQYLWGCFKEVAAEARQRAAWLEKRPDVDSDGGRGFVVHTGAGSRSFTSVKGKGA